MSKEPCPAPTPINRRTAIMGALLALVPASAIAVTPFLRKGGFQVLIAGFDIESLLVPHSGKVALPLHFVDLGDLVEMLGDAERVERDRGVDADA